MPARTSVTRQVDVFVTTWAMVRSWPHHPILEPGSSTQDPQANGSLSLEWAAADPGPVICEQFLVASMSDQRRVPDPEMIPDWQQIARQQDQRQWPPPARPWLIRQTWRDLLFAHWPVASATLRPLIPAHLELETFGGDAWVGVVPFELRNLTARRAHNRLSLSFPELNVRTYVTLQDRPGVWFFSLDAASLLAVRGARATYSLPYYWATMHIGQQDEWITYRSQRRGSTAAQFSARYRPTGPVIESAPDSLERWLSARYCLYTANRGGQILRAEINHDPWLLQPAEAEITVNTMASAQGIDLTGSPLLHFARHTDVVNWGLERVS